MEIACACLQVTDADKPLGKSVYRTFRLERVQFTIEIKVDTLPAGMDTGIGTARTHNADWGSECYRESLLEGGLHRHELGLTGFVLFLPAVKSAA